MAKEGETIKDRYLIQKPLGKGSMGATYLARDTANERDVAVKILRLEQLKDWKTLELFEREARILKNLNHRFIPDYIDSFNINSSDNPKYILVQEFVPGTNLLDKVKDGWRATESEIRNIAVKLLSIVRYIHSLNPPVIHRDINPKNVIQSEDGEVYLVDFGGVQETFRSGLQNESTVVGTPGYTPMEQFVGKATKESDLYAIAATILFLLTHKNPTELPIDGMRIDLARCISVSDELYGILKNWLEPDARQRTLNLDAATDILEGKTAAPKPKSDLAKTIPHGSSIQVHKKDGDFMVTIPGQGVSAIFKNPQIIFIGIFGTVWLSFVAFWTFTALSMGAPLIFPLFSIPFWLVGFYLAYRVLFTLFGLERITISAAEGVHYVRKLLFLHSEVRAPLDAVGRCTIETVQTQNQNRTTVCQFNAGVRRVRIGMALSDTEKEWLRDAINEHLSRGG